MWTTRNGLLLPDTWGSTWLQILPLYAFFTTPHTSHSRLYTPAPSYSRLPSHTASYVCIKRAVWVYQCLVTLTRGLLCLITTLTLRNYIRMRTTSTIELHAPLLQHVYWTQILIPYSVYTTIDSLFITTADAPSSLEERGRLTASSRLMLYLRAQAEIL